MHTDPNEKDVDQVSQWEKHSDESSMRKHQFVVVVLGNKYQFSAKWSHSSKWETESVKIVAVKCPQSLFGEMEYEIRKNLQPPTRIGISTSNIGRAMADSMPAPAVPPAKSKRPAAAAFGREDSAVFCRA